ncbi:MAG: lytic transglycosylase domain-containing protein, partial [archaeon]
GDSGLTQLNPVLWDSRISTEYVCNPFNPVESIEVSAKYYRSLAEKFKDRRLALTAYNQGDSRVMGKLRRGLSADKIAASNPNNYYKKVESQKIN